jgi:asparagine synthase (glutamine-hydrolysing)
MCGINGFTFNDEKLIGQMNLSIKHRGPDDNGYYCKGNLSFGQVRLSIIDLSFKGHQPMFYSKSNGASNEKFNKKFIDESDYSIVFNGEIYNYLELKEELKLLGYNFTTESDTEVILASYDAWGEKCLQKFNGMWAFCINDKTNETLFLSRDKLGQKPLYYSLIDEGIIFTSELKAMYSLKSLIKASSVNADAINLFFGLGFIPAPYTIYENISKLEAGHYLIFDLKTNQTKKNEYRIIPDYKPCYNHKKNKKDVLELLNDSVKLRLRSDVEVGAFLSGGVDSSSVVGMMKKLHNLKMLNTFSIGFEGKYDETPKINILEKEFRTKHHHKYFNKKDIDCFLEDFFYMYDEPFADQSGFPTNMVSNLASKKVKVSLSGDGGDEIFGGYPKHKIAFFRYRFRKVTPKLIIKLLSKFSKFLLTSKIEFLNKLGVILNILICKDWEFDMSFDPNNNFTPEVLNSWYKQSYKKLLRIMPSAEAVIKHDLFYKTLPDNFLQKVDRASMYNGLEVRSPFLDYRFVELSSKLPLKSKTDFKTTKKILREVVKTFIPKEILEDKNKSGFSPPFREWLQEKNYDLKFIYQDLKVKNLISDEVAEFFDKKFNENNGIKQVYKIRLFMYYMWCKKWLEI